MKNTFPIYKGVICIFIQCFICLKFFCFICLQLFCLLIIGLIDNFMETNFSICKFYTYLLHLTLFILLIATFIYCYFVDYFHSNIYKLNSSMYLIYFLSEVNITLSISILSYSYSIYLNHYLEYILLRGLLIYYHLLTYLDLPIQVYFTLYFLIYSVLNLFFIFTFCSSYFDY